ncbi:thymidine kinase 2, mitochondrial-like isoform X2 [Tubulanus polymorphus]
MNFGRYLSRSAASCKKVLRQYSTPPSQLQKMAYRRMMEELKKLTGWNTNERLTVCVEGNIASGKTTLLEYFQNDSRCEMVVEPMKKWRNIRGKNALALMYEDPYRWSLTFQTYVQLTMLQAHKQPHTKPVKLMERSIYSAKYCFVENLYRNKIMPEIEYIVLSEWFDYILETSKIECDLIVYLRTKPEVVYERIKKRGRLEEQSVSVEYLQTLHELHEDWLVRKKFPVPSKVLVIEADKCLPDMTQVYEEYRSQILQSSKSG